MAYRAAIIGCGMIAGRFEDFSSPATYSHAKAYRKHAAFGEIALYDHNPDRAVELAMKAGGKAFTSISEMMANWRPHAVSVCTPDNLHFPVIELLMQSTNAPSVIFAEKPVCNTNVELAQLRQLESSGKSIVIVNHSRRFDDAHRRLRDLLNAGDLGPLVQVHVDYYGGWRHLGVHIVDVLQFFFATAIEIDRAGYACASKYSNDPTLNVEGSIGTASLRIEGFPENNYQILDMNIMCERGQIKVTDFGKRIEVFRKTVNAENENVLLQDQAIPGIGMQNCISSAVDLISRHLDCGDMTILEQYGLVEAQKTMNTIWKGTEIYAAQS